jgi:hypothetical protein
MSSNWSLSSALHNKELNTSSISPMPSKCPTHPPNKNILFVVFASLLLPSPSQGHNVFHSYKKNNRSISLFSNRIKRINILKRVHYNWMIWQTKQIPFTNRSLKSASRRRRDCSQCLSNSSSAELDSTSSQQNASLRIWQCQRHCARDTDAVISTARVYGNTSVHTDGS